VGETGKRSRRQQYADQTRAAVIESAHRLFVERGYAATSLREIAVDANVSEQTVYRVFGDKAELLRAVVLTAVGVEGEAGSLREGSLIATVAAGSSPEVRLRLVAQVARDAYGRGLAELDAVLAAAASADERVAEFAREAATAKYEDVRSLVIGILGDAELDGLTIDDVVDYVYATESSPVYLALTLERGWTTEQYVDWFVDMFERMFLSRLRERPPEP
jgi:AcrR family transcriptional regulator